MMMQIERGHGMVNSGSRTDIWTRLESLAYSSETRWSGPDYLYDSSDTDMVEVNDAIQACYVAENIELNSSHVITQDLVTTRAVSGISQVLHPWYLRTEYE